MRNDIHRSGAIIPADYDYVLSYNLATTHDNWPIPSFRVMCDKQAHHGDRCCIVRINETGKLASHGGMGKCTACGANFVYGDVWQHRATGEFIHLGHDCADKYEFLADRSEQEMALLRARKAAELSVRRMRCDAERETFLAAHDGLREALETDHRIVRLCSSLRRKHVRQSRRSAPR